MSAPVCRTLKTICSNFSTGLICHGLLQTLTSEVIKSNRVILKEDGLYIVRSGQSLQMAPNESFYEVQCGGPAKWNINHAALEFAKMLLRNFTIDSYEALFAYCESTGQLPPMQAQPWYQFARMVRNSLTHTQHWKFRQGNLSKLPVSWHGKTINASMDGKMLDFDFYDWYDGCELWSEMYQFAETLK